jgi:exosortase/archaeosortase family protein
VNGRAKEFFVLVAVLGAGWWAAVTTTVAAWEQAGAAIAAGLVLYAAARRPAVAVGVGHAAAVMVAAVGLALGWAWPAALALAWVAGRGEAPGLVRWQAGAMACFSVPWLVADATALGWGFRWTGAAAAAGLFDLSGLAVTRSGTALQIEDQPLAVDAACAGLDTLQATLVAGLWLAAGLRTARGWAWAVAVLPPLVWLANTARIVVLGAVAVTAGHEAAKGWFHEWGGLAVVVFVFVPAGAWVAWLRRGERATEGAAR